MWPVSDRARSEQNPGGGGGAASYVFGAYTTYQLRNPRQCISLRPDQRRLVKSKPTRPCDPHGFQVLSVNGAREFIHNWSPCFVERSNMRMFCTWVALTTIGLQLSLLRKQMRLQGQFEARRI